MVGNSSEHYTEKKAGAGPGKVTCSVCKKQKPENQTAKCDEHNFYACDECHLKTIVDKAKDPVNCPNCQSSDKVVVKFS